MTTSMKDIFERFWAHITNKIDNLTYNWNDLTDRPFYNERVYYVGNYRFFECFDQMDEPYDRFYYDQSQTFDVYKLLKEGQEYIVAYEDADGRYKENTYIGTDVDGNIAIGNLSFYDESYPDTGEPFIIFYLVNHEWGFVGTKEPGEVELYEFSTIEVKLLDEKYIPETIARADHTHSWNDLTDKPFGEEKNYIWSGTYADMELLETRIIGGDECVRVSDFIEVEDLNQAEYIMYENGKPLKKSQTLDLDDFEFESNYVKCSNDGIYVVGESFEDNGVTIPYGLWIRKDEWYFVGEIYRLIFKQLDSKFIGDDIVDKVLSALPTWTGGTY